MQKRILSRKIWLSWWKMNYNNAFVALIWCNDSKIIIYFQCYNESTKDKMWCKHGTPQENKDVKSDAFVTQKDTRVKHVFYLHHFWDSNETRCKAYVETSHAQDMKLMQKWCHLYCHVLHRHNLKKDPKKYTRSYEV